MLQTHSSAVTAAATVVIALATIVVAVYTWRVTQENKILRKVSGQPHVVAFIRPDRRSVTAFNLIFENVGGGLAFDVSFEAKISEYEINRNRIKSPEQPTVPINVIPSGDRLETFFGSSIEMFENPTLESIELVVKFRDVEGTYRNTRNDIDIRPFKEFKKLSESSTGDIVAVLKEINMSFKNLTFFITKMQESSKTKVYVDTSGKDD